VLCAQLQGFAHRSGWRATLDRFASAAVWPDCQSNGYICVGWDEVGDLRQYESKDAFRGTFRDAFDYSTDAKAKEKADEVWLLLDLAVGERVVANKGTKQVLAIGRIASPGYV